MNYNIQNIAILKKKLVAQKLTVALAESVTGGHLQAAISGADEAGMFFHGGITAYNLGQKARHLKINSIAAEKCNCVSKEVAIEMAFGVIELFSSDMGISITGYAAPLPEEDIHTIFAWGAIVLKGKLISSFKITSKLDDPIRVQIDYTNQVIVKAIKSLK
jgi:nicotinamide-nucleotide amidase